MKKDVASLIRDEEARLKRKHRATEEKARKIEREQERKQNERRKIWDAAQSNLRDLFTSNPQLTERLSTIWRGDAYELWTLHHEYQADDGLGGSFIGNALWNLLVIIKSFQLCLDINGPENSIIDSSQKVDKIPEPAWTELLPTLRVLANSESAVRFFYRTELPLQLKWEYPKGAPIDYRDIRRSLE